MKVELVSKTTGVGKYSELNSEEIVAAIARHGVIKEDNGKLVKYLMDSHHWSPLDMINFSFEIETSRAIGRQILRHSSIKPQEHSQRYSDRVLFEPIELRKEHPTNRQSSTEVFNPELEEYGWSYSNEFLDKTPEASEAIKHHLKKVQGLYLELIEAGVAKECVRMILPECTLTTMTMNGSLRSWLAFLNVRMDKHTQKECRLIAEEIGNILEKELPNIFGRIDWKKGLFM
jgi:thymidylate synthase (FAD)